MIWFVITATFLMTAAIPADPAKALLGPHADTAAVERVRAHYCLDDGLLTQYGCWLSSVVRGDLGESYRSKRPVIDIIREDKRFVIRLSGCVSAAHAIAAATLELSRDSKPPGVHFGWPEMDLLTASWSYFAFGEGNIPWKVRDLIQRGEPDSGKRPRVIVG